MTKLADDDSIAIANSKFDVRVLRQRRKSGAVEISEDGSVILARRLVAENVVDTSRDWWGMSTLLVGDTQCTDCKLAKTRAPRVEVIVHEFLQRRDVD